MKKKLLNPVKILPRNVLLATPQLTNSSLPIWYVDSLVNTIRIASRYNINLDITYIFNDALLQRTRNDLIKIALEKNVDDLVWINSDLYWNPEWVFRLLNHNVDVVGGTYPEKYNIETYNLKAFNNEIIVDKKTGLFEVEKMGLGFLRISKKVLISLWNSNPAYTTKNKDIGKLIFDIVLDKDGCIIKEDEVFFTKLTNLGYKIYLDPSITCQRFGQKKYSRNFKEYLKNKQFL